MKLWSLEGNAQRLDGGAMFGNCPKALWSRWCAPDEANRIRLTCRSLLIELDDGRLVLLETGIGAFFAPDLRARYGVESSEHVLLDALARRGRAPDDIDVIVLSHLHFDHAGGLLLPWQEGVPPQLAFPRARFLVGKRAWERAKSPHPRDRASFIPELGALLLASERLELVDGTSSDTLGEAFSFSESDGHTPGMLLTRVSTPHGPLTFMADLVPGVPWVHLPITMGYDRFPEQLIEEKSTALDAIRDDHGWMFFTHDADIAAARVGVDERGRYIAMDCLAEISW